MIAVKINIISTVICSLKNVDLFYVTGSIHRLLTMTPYTDTLQIPKYKFHTKIN